MVVDKTNFATSYAELQPFHRKWGGEASDAINDLTAFAVDSALVSTSGDQTSRLNTWLADTSVLGVKKAIGDFSVSDTLTVPVGTYLDLSKAKITQTGTNKVTINLGAGATVFGGDLTGKGTDYSSGGSPLAMGISAAGDGCAVIGTTLRNFSGAAIRGYGVTNFQISDFTIVGVGSPTIVTGDGGPCNGILIDLTSKGITISNGDISAVCQGIQTGRPVTNVMISSVRIHDIPGQHGCYIQNGAGLNINGLDIWTTNLNGLKVQKAVTDAEDDLGGVITGVTATNCNDTGVILTQTASDLTSAKIFRGFTISNIAVFGCRRGAYFSSVADSVISNISAVNTTETAITFINCRNIEAANFVWNQAGRFGILFNLATGSTQDQIRIKGIRGHNAAQNNDGTNIDGIQIAKGSNITLSDATITATNTFMRYALFVSTGTATDQQTLALRNLDFSGSTVSARFQATITSVREWINVRTTGTIMNPPTLNTVTLNLRTQPGVVGDGVADDAAAINSAATVAANLGLRLFGNGTFKINSTVTLLCDADMSGATFNYSGSGIAVQVGSATALRYKSIDLPTIVALGKVGTGWAGVAGTTGLKIVNVNTSRIRVPRIVGFEVGLLVRGEGAVGCAYNAIYVQHLDNNKVQHDISSDATGWSNKNHYWIDRSSFNSAEGSIVSGTRNIRLQTSANLPNNNIWWGGSVEGNVAEYHVECAGAENRFMHMRWENGGTGCRAYWRVGSFSNMIDGGYDSYKITDTYEAGLVIGATTTTAKGSKLTQATGTAGKAVLQIENTSSSSYPAVSIMAAGAVTSGADPATAYTAQFCSNAWRGKAAADAFDRIRIDPTNGRLYVGSGTALTSKYFGAYGSSSMGFDGSNVGFVTDNTYDFGITGGKPRYVRAGTAVQTGAFATGSRPAAATAGAGACIFDTTLGKPIWVNAAATGWVDATGATV